MDDYISKPVKTETLRNVLERWSVSLTEQAETAEEKPGISSNKGGHHSVDISVLDSFRDFQQTGQPDLVTELINLFIEDAKKRLSSLKKAITRKIYQRLKKKLIA
jgi:YesN/AraC family two-component response regulator